MEATPSTIALALHLIARHPEVQDKLRAEVMRVLKRDYGCIEIRSFVSRRAESDYEFNGMKIPRGLSIMAAVTYIHHDPELWSEPETFDPERFNPDNKPYIHPISFQPFGKGPRACLGLNFALLEMKLILSKVIATYKLSVDEEHHKAASW
ncbi:hypothetical protein HPB52_017409 [Rhipicephalus sanguineus]|uniref:Cytochrome P450 n=1 Tax=Rhipicephalus sanguineus TaxID=34632 RepID=A0A9D4TAZ8_RHISA|nr:hypothetical protein HPB52_017409 [Rhipicephalus sanguineus]